MYGLWCSWDCKHSNSLSLGVTHCDMCISLYRDRAPFVFTSDMAYVINGGDKPSSRFHDFVDLCCQAYNLIRKHTHLFLNLLGLVSETPTSCCPQPPIVLQLSRPHIVIVSEPLCYCWNIQLSFSVTVLPRDRTLWWSELTWETVNCHPNLQLFHEEPRLISFGHSVL